MIFRRKIEVTRREGGEWVSGEWYRGDPHPFSVYASVQPEENVTGNQSASEAGNDIARTILLITNTELWCDKPPEREADVIHWDGSLWKVIRVDRWANGIIPHYEVTAEEVL